MTFQFEKLLAYQKSVDFADDICATTEKFPRGYGFLVDQLNCAALSISANIAEGDGRFTKADRKNFFIIARGSVQEPVALLELARRLSLLNEAAHAEPASSANVVQKRFECYQATGETYMTSAAASVGVDDLLQRLLDSNS